MCVVLYGCKTWSLTLREECRQRVLKKLMLRRVFGPKRDEVTWEWIKLHNKELNDLYYSPTIVWVIKGDQMEKNEVDGACSTCGGEESCIQGFGGET